MERYSSANTFLCVFCAAQATVVATPFCTITTITTVACCGATAATVAQVFSTPAMDHNKTN